MGLLSVLLQQMRAFKKNYTTGNEDRQKCEKKCYNVDNVYVTGKYKVTEK